MRPTRRRAARRRVLAFLLTGLCCLGAPPSRAQDAQAELEALRRAIEGHRERVGDYERRARGLLETLEGMDRAAHALRADALGARREAEGARETLEKLEARAGGR